MGRTEHRRWRHRWIQGKQLGLSITSEIHSCCTCAYLPCVMMICACAGTPLNLPTDHLHQDRAASTPIGGIPAPNCQDVMEHTMKGSQTTTSLNARQHSFVSPGRKWMHMQAVLPTSANRAERLGAGAVYFHCLFQMY